MSETCKQNIMFIFLTMHAKLLLVKIIKLLIIWWQ